MKAPVSSSGIASAIAVGSVIVIMLATVWHAFGGPAALFAVLVAAAAVFIAVEYRNIPPKLRQTALFLFTTGVVLLPFAKSPLLAVQRGIFISSLLLSLMGSVMLLAHCALRSQHIRAVGISLHGRRPEQRYVWFTGASQVFSAMLGMAGANIMLVMAAPPNEGKSASKSATVTAVMRGFSAACLWSPVMGNMAILLALYPTLHWVEVFPVGVALAQITVVVGVLMNRFNRNATLGSAPPAPPEPATNAGLAAAIPVFAAMLAFLGLLLVASNLLEISISVAIVMLGPIVALMLNLAMAEPGRRWRDGLLGMHQGAQQLPRLASEAIVFAAAGCSGSILADAFPAAWANQIGGLLGDLPFFGIAFLMLGIMAIALAGIHPVLSSVFMASTITPDILQLPAITHLGAILAGWALSSSVTPYSVLSLTASRYSGDSLYQISIGKNWAFALVSSMLGCAMLTAVAMAMR